MKTIRKHLKLISPLLSLIFILYSCNAYVKPVNYETAINSGKKVKVTMLDKTSYKFTKIYEEDNQLIGLAKLKSRTSKKLNKEVFSENDNYKYFLLNEEEILKFKQISPLISVLETIGLVFVSILGLGGIAIIAGGGGVPIY